ncbi:uncharacterized protein LOC142235371 [Haematobia irritans]|uniref:uncharacterized protein LOC142235371 n=1 Tax=Haematobia irritans TaxID=7368 RepID=UPI003F50B29D
MTSFNSFMYITKARLRSTIFLFSFLKNEQLTSVLYDDLMSVILELFMEHVHFPSCNEKISIVVQVYKAKIAKEFLNTMLWLNSLHAVNTVPYYVFLIGAKYKQSIIHLTEYPYCQAMAKCSISSSVKFPQPIMRFTDYQLFRTTMSASNFSIKIKIKPLNFCEIFITICTKTKKKIKLALILFLLELIEKEEQPVKRIWIQGWLKKRSPSNVRLVRELSLTAPQDYKNYLRMDTHVFEELLDMISPLIQKQDTHLRDAKTPNERLIATLRFLATGQTFSDLKFEVYMGTSTLSGIIIETCLAIIKSLRNYIRLPRCEDDWKEVAVDFENLWNFPHCIGAMDGKHIKIRKPNNSGSYYFNYKKNFSIVLLALVNANCEFLMVEVGANGRVSDGGVYANSKIRSMYESGQLNLPNSERINNFNIELPYVFVTDNAFPLGKHFMKPYCTPSLSIEQIYFNYRLSRARRIVENAFGIIASRFRILLGTINLSPAKTRIVVLAICYLHNFLKSKTPNAYLQNIKMAEIPQQNCNNDNNIDDNLSSLGKLVRNDFCTYFNNNKI